ncbi:MAG: hypothetical protein CRU72_00885 [Candidatus Accumulibacter phosphatis]|nr:hypothetical protein [Candidatus Accumulibacter phosphatis]
MQAASSGFFRKSDNSYREIKRMKKPIALSAAALVAIFSTFSGAATAADTASPAPAAVPMSTGTRAPATEISKEQAVEMALKAHPGEVTKVYQDTKKGKKTWEVKVLGKDGKRWELHYEIKSGALVSEESK